MVAVGRVKLLIQFPVAGLNAQQVAVGTGIKPFAVYRFRLLATTQRDAQCTLSQLLDLPDQIGDVCGECPVVPLPALDHHRAEALFQGMARSRHHVGVVEGVAFNLPVAGPDAAIKAILAAYI